MLLQPELTESDRYRIASLITRLVRHWDALEPTRRLATLNALLRVSIARNVNYIVVPPMDDLPSDEDPDSRDGPDTEATYRELDGFPH